MENKNKTKSISEVDKETLQKVLTTAKRTKLKVRKNISENKLSEVPEDIKDFLDSNK